MSRDTKADFKEGFSKGIGLTTGVLAIPVAGLLLFGVYRVLEVPIRDLLRSEELYEYYDCVEKRIKNFEERTAVLKKVYADGYVYEKDIDVKVPPRAERCERPTREWKWQPKN